LFSNYLGVVLQAQKVYFETTMFNYYFDQDRDGHLATISMFEATGQGEYTGYTSEYVLIELKKAEEH
jgi:hypothetical protein